jgi:GNAT superfamily N-acetyltransferase
MGDNDPFELRRLTVDDWAVWREVRLQALRDAPYAFSSTLTQWQGDGDREARWRSRLETVPFNAVAVVAGKPVGQVSGTEPETTTGYVELLSMWVAPEARGRGVGRTLVEAVVQWASSRAANGVTLSVKRSNEAIVLYKRCGFVPTPARSHTPDDEQIMVRHA